MQGGRGGGGGGGRRGFIEIILIYLKVEYRSNRD